MKKGSRDGKIMDGQTYDSVLPEAYAKVKHERDQVVAGFNKLKQHNDKVNYEQQLLVNAVREFIEDFSKNNKPAIREGIHLLNTLVN